MERWLSWSKAHDWKSCVGLNPTEGSNPSLSARTEQGNSLLCFLFSYKKALGLIKAQRFLHHLEGNGSNSILGSQ